MNTLAGLGSAACLALALVSTTQAQENLGKPRKEATFHRMEQAIDKVCDLWERSYPVR